MAHWPIMKSIAGFIIPKFDGCMVEIGSGHSTRILNELAVQFKRKFYSCDIRDIQPEALSQYHTIKVMPSSQLREEWDSYGEKPVMVFIDGNHSYKVVKEDFYFFYERMVPGGVIFMHDLLPATEGHLSASMCGDAYKLRLEIEKDPNIEMITFPHETVHFGMGVVFKRYRYQGYAPPGEHYDY